MEAIISHTTTIKGVQITDANAIRAAVADLQRAGISINLLENATPRMFYENQAREVGRCEFVLNLPNSRYDIGLKWNAKEKQYDAILDTWAGDIAREVGAEERAYCEMPSTERYGKDGEIAIGRFTQRYGVNAAKQAAMSQGFFIEGETVDQTTGAIQLVIAGM